MRNALTFSDFLEKPRFILDINPDAYGDQESGKEGPGAITLRAVDSKDAIDALKKLSIMAKTQGNRLNKSLIAKGLSAEQIQGLMDYPPFIPGVENVGLHFSVLTLGVQRTYTADPESGSSARYVVTGEQRERKRQIFEAARQYAASNPDPIDVSGVIIPLEPDNMAILPPSRREPSTDDVVIRAPKATIEVLNEINSILEGKGYAPIPVDSPDATFNCTILSNNAQEHPLNIVKTNPNDPTTWVVQNPSPVSGIFKQAQSSGDDAASQEESQAMTSRLR